MRLSVHDACNGKNSTRCLGCTFIYYWLWSAPSAAVVYIIYDILDNSPYFGVGFLLFGVALMWLLSPLYSVAMIGMLATELTSRSIADIDPGFATWRLGLVVPGIFVILFAIASAIRGWLVAQGWVLSVAVSVSSLSLRGVSGLLTKGGYL